MQVNSEVVMLAGTANLSCQRRLASILRLEIWMPASSGMTNSAFLYLAAKRFQTNPKNKPAKYPIVPVTAMSPKAWPTLKPET